MLVQIDYNLTFTAPFHMGTGISTNALDRTVVRDTAKNLYIPASTFKGVLREQCEHLLRFYLPTQEIASPHDASATLREFGRTPNLISHIFGSQLYPGSLRFADIKQRNNLPLNDPELQKGTTYDLQTSVFTQARIDRLTGIAADKALYTSEFGNPILSFAGTIKGQLDCTPLVDLAFLAEDARGTYILTPTYSLLLLLAGILLIERIGGNKSSGKGECYCKIREVWLDRRKCREVEEENEEGWRFWLEHLDRLSDYKQEELGE